MIEDASEDHRTIGIIQPQVPDFADNRGEAGADEREPELYEVGCAGLLDQIQELPQGRYLIILKGLCRFRVRAEVESTRGYRRAQVDYRDFAVDDDDQGAEIVADDLLSALGKFGSSQGLSIDMDKLERVSGIALLNGLAMNLPFAPAEKQALLEAENVRARYQMLLDLFRMGFTAQSSLEN